MARSPQYWYDFMIAERNSMASMIGMLPTIDSAQTFLNDAGTSSKVSRTRTFFWVVACCAYALELVVDLAVATMELLAKKSRFGILPWYVNQALLFQYGDALVLQNDEYQYPILNPNNQIIKRAAAQEDGNTINVKVAKLVGNNPTPLSAGEKSAVVAYFAKVKPAGSDVVIISDPPDELRLFPKVNYDPLLLDSTGQLITAPGTYPVRDAINSYISNLNVSNFNGVLELCDLVDAMQAAIGVISVYIPSASARYGSNPYTVFNERYQANAGHLVIDPTNPLSTSITYQSINV